MVDDEYAGGRIRLVVIIDLVTKADLPRERFPRDARYRRPDDELGPVPGRTVGE